MKERDTTQQGTAAQEEEMLPSVAEGLKKCLIDHCNNVSLHNANPAAHSGSSGLSSVPAPFSLFPAMHRVDSY